MAKVIKSTHPINHYSDGGRVRSAVEIAEMISTRDKTPVGRKVNDTYE